MSNLCKTIQRTVKTNDFKRMELLQAAFALICNPDDWKAPIDCIVPFSDASFFYDAIVSITGTVPNSERQPDGSFRLTSVGYRMGPCGDY